MTTQELALLRRLEDFIERNAITEDDERKLTWLCDMIEMFKEQNT